MLMGLPRPDRVSAGGACHLLDCADGAIALSLPRPDDWDLLPALFEDAAPTDWARVAEAVRSRPADLLVGRARLLGLAVARADLRPAPPAAPAVIHRLAPPRPPEPGRVPLVLDLSALWAGPLAGHLLERGGARVIKVESPQRIDGARRGNAEFYNLLNQHKLSVTADLATSAGRQRLLDLIAGADVVFESSRPRALRHHGIVAEALVASRPGLTWVSLTAHGRGAPEEDWTGFGDDAAAAGGLCAAVREATGSLAFIGDAVADPLTGIAAAREAWRGWRAGGGALVSLSLSGSVAAALYHDCSVFAERARPMLTQAAREGYPPPDRRAPDGPAAPLGAHDDRPLESLVSC